MSVTGIRSGLVALALTAGAVNALAGEVVQADISKLAYTPAEINIHLGDTVRWTNHDFIAHTATAKSGATSGAWDVMIPAGKTADWQATEVGSVQYFCRFHPNMKGNINVRAN